MYNGMVRHLGNNLLNDTVNKSIFEEAKNTLLNTNFVGFYGRHDASKEWIRN
jgi:hypothetical protein